MRVVFCGNPEFAIPTLDNLLRSSHQVLSVITSPDKPQGRGKKIEPLPVKQYALKSGLSVLQPASLKNVEFLESVRLLNPDCFVVTAFRILPKEMLGLPPQGALNVHPSLLPKGRGPAPMQWTLLRGETETGVSIIRLTEQIDAGGILKQERTTIATDENFGTLHDRLSLLGARLLLEVLDDIERGENPSIIAQDESQVTKAPKLFSEDFRIEWTKPAPEIHNRIRALSPAPGAVTLMAGMRFKILSAETVCEQISLSPGELHVSIDGMLVGTGNGVLKLKEIQPEGRRVMNIEDFLRGRPVLSTHFGG